MKKTSFFIPLCIIFGLISTGLQAQDLNDEMKKKLRQSLIAPEKKQGAQQQYQPAPQILPNQDSEILKVSPWTKLPTKADRILLLYPPEKYKIYINTTVTNSTPINQLPPGSVRYEHVGKNLVMVTTAGQLVKPSGMDSGPIRKKHKKKANILKAFQK